MLESIVSKMKIFSSKYIKNAYQCFKTFICMTLERSCLKFYIVSYPLLLQAHDNNDLLVYLYHDLYVMTLDSFNAFTVTVMPKRFVEV